MKHAIYGYTWSENPFWVTDGGWLPGWLYFSGLANWFFPNPVWAPRLMNLILGTSTILLLYKFIETTFDKSTALLSAALLSILPLHISLSASSLTEISFLFFLLSGAWLTITEALAVTRKRWFVLLLASLMVVLATMVRYEAWFVAPIFPIAFLALSRSWLRSSIFAAGIVIFPVFWILGNFSYFGTALPIVAGAVKGTAAGPTALSVVEAISVLVNKVANEVGWYTLVIGFLGLFCVLHENLKVNFSWKRIFALLLLLLLAAFLVRFAMSRGPSIWSRSSARTLW